MSLTWMSLLCTLDPGTMGGDQGTPPFLFSMLVVTLGGIFLVSTLIGILTSGIEAKLEELRKGRSFVVEQNHTLILGWSPQVFTIISEVVAANANQKRPCIVILADKDKVAMEDEARAKVPKTGKTRVVCRTGSPLDLAIVNPNAARDIQFNTSKVRFFRKYRGALVAEILRAFLWLMFIYQIAEESFKWLLGHKRELRAQRVKAYWLAVRSKL